MGTSTRTSAKNGERSLKLGRRRRLRLLKKKRNKKRGRSPEHCQHNLRVSVAVLTILATLLVQQVLCGVPLTTPIILCVTHATFEAHGIQWLPTLSWCRTFAERIGLALRKGTRAARHLPANFVEISHLHILRFVWLVVTFSLLACFVFNMDETGLRFMPMKKQTWAPKGAKQVDITALDDKRQFTAMPIINAAGEICGHVQMTWQGKTAGCQPSAAVQAKYAETLSHAATPSHWSTPHTMEAAVDDLFQTYFVPKCAELNLNPNDTYWLICWDVYSSHRDKDLLRRLKLKYRMYTLHVSEVCLLCGLLGILSS